MNRILPILAEIGTTAQEPLITNPLLDENGELVSTQEAVSNLSKLWEEWDIIDKLTDAIPKIIIAVVLIVLGLWLSRLISKLVVKSLKRHGVDASVYLFISKIVSVLIKICFVLFALSLFFNINSFLAAIGALGLTAGMGLQSNVAQFASGIQILLTRPFKAGDYVQVAGNEGFVAEIRFMSTVINTADNKRVIIPNSHITTNELINFSAEDKRRVDLVYSISYSQDIEKARQVILDVAEANEKILKDPQAAVFVNTHEASSINLLARVWCGVSDYWDVYFSMQEQVKLAFDKAGIEIPFNQLDVHIVDKSTK